MARSFEEIAGAYSPDVQAVAQRARQLILKSLPKVEETIDPTTAVASYGYGPGYKGMVCTLIFSKAGVKMGFVGGADLPDPEKLLDGKGKMHKYVDLRSPADVDRRGIKDLMKAALAKRESR